MRTLIIYKSYHKMNTEKIAKVMAQAMNADLVKVEDVNPEELVKYDLIGFGSGIYASKLHIVREKLIEKGCKVIGEFNCAGEFSPFGFNLDKKGHPDENDMESARMFAEGLMHL